VRKEPIIGVDLGTTNSCCAIVDGEKDGVPTVKLIPYNGGDYTVPSIFAIDDKGNELIGYEAKRQWQLNPKNTIYGAKRLVGRSFSSDIVNTMQKVVAYKLKPSVDNKEVLLDVGKRELSLQEVSARILNKIRDVASNHLRVPIHRAVVTVPAYFSSSTWRWCGSSTSPPRRRSPTE
jgi:molecular chaperone DnaK